MGYIKNVEEPPPIRLKSENGGGGGTVTSVGYLFGDSNEGVGAEDMERDRRGRGGGISVRKTVEVSSDVGLDKDNDGSSVSSGDGEITPWPKSMRHGDMV